MPSSAIECPLCQQQTILRKDGKLELHGSTPPGHCTGSGHSLYRVKRLVATGQQDLLASWPRA